MENGEHQGSKKARVELPMGQAKQEVEILEEDGSIGEGAMVAVEDEARGVEITVRIGKAKLHCPVCILPLKPPIFQCSVDHLACSACHGQLPNDDLCYTCGRAGGYGRSTVLEDFVRSARILCPYDVHGCRSYVTYYDVADHQSTCPPAPCRCSEPGCGFAGSPPMLRDHLAAVPRSWPMDTFCYGSVLQLRVPDPKQRRLLVAEEDGRVFLLSAGALRVVSVVCVRASVQAVRRRPRGGGDRPRGDGGAEQLRVRRGGGGGSGVPGCAAPDDVPPVHGVADGRSH